MANVTQTITQSADFSNTWAEGYLEYDFVEEERDDGWYAAYQIIPDGSASGFMTVDLSQLPNNVNILSVDLQYSITQSGYTSYTTKGITTPDIGSSGTVNERILSYLNQTPRPESLRLGFYLNFQSGRVIYKKFNRSHSEHQHEEVTAYMNRAKINLSVTYEQTQNNGTVSYGVNNTYQKCNVYYGTGNEWKKCKAYYGSGGQWVECK